MVRAILNVREIKNRYNKNGIHKHSNRQDSKTEQSNKSDINHKTKKKDKEI